MGNVNELIARWAAAERSADTAALAGLLTEDFRAVGPLGFTLDKTAWIGRYASGDLVNEEFTVGDIESRDVGTVSVATAVQEQRAAHRGRPVPGRFRVTIVASLPEDRIARVH